MVEICLSKSLKNETVGTAFGILFIWAMTSLGSAIVFIFRKPMSERVRAGILAGASGIMVSASFFALLLPSLEEAKEQNLTYPFWIPALVGYFLGCVLILVVDLVIPCVVKPDPRPEEESSTVAIEEISTGSEHVLAPIENLSGEDSKDKMNVAEARKVWKLFLSVTLHNIPEGVATGLVFGAAHKATTNKDEMLRSAIGLALGIGIQNIPEGAAIALSTKEMTHSTCKGFLYGVMSGIVEPVFAGFSFLISAALEKIDPWALAFSAGAMMYVVIEELVPVAQNVANPSISTWCFNIGFLAMIVIEFGISF
jgi:ZIP family zinc transporter